MSKRPRKRHKPVRRPTQKPGPGAPRDGLMRFLGLKTGRKPLHHEPGNPPTRIAFGVPL
jgi:hypothetical protein